MIDGNEKTAYCSIIIRGKESGEKRVETLGEATTYLLNQPKEILAEDWTIQLTCGYYELSLCQFRQLCHLPNLRVIGAGVHSEVPTAIRLFGFRFEDLEEIGRITKKLAYAGLRIEV